MTLIKAMLTKNALKRTLKLEHVKMHEYFKDYDWDGLVSFNLESPYRPKLQEDSLKEVMSYNEYIKVLAI